MENNLGDHTSVLLHVLWKLAHHGNDKLGKTGDEELHVFIPIARLKDGLKQLLIQWADLIRASNEESIYLESIAHQIRLIRLNDEIQGFTQVLLQASEFLGIVSQVF